LSLAVPPADVLRVAAPDEMLLLGTKRLLLAHPLLAELRPERGEQELDERLPGRIVRVDARPDRPHLPPLKLHRVDVVDVDPVLLAQRLFDPRLSLRVLREFLHRLGQDLARAP